MRPVDIVEDHLPDVRRVPAPAGRSVGVCPFEPPDHGVRSLNLPAYHLEHSPHERHLVLIDEVTVSLFVVAEAVIGCLARDDFPAPGLFEFLGECSVGYLGVFVLGEVVLNGPHEALFGGVLVLVLQRPQGAAVLSELFLKHEYVAALARYPVALGSEDKIDAALLHDMPYPVYARSPKGVSLVTVVHGLRQNLVAHLFRVPAKLPELDREGVALLCLFVGGDAGVKDGPLGPVAVGAGHGHSFGSSSDGSTLSALASLRMVRYLGSTLSVSMRLIVSGWTSALAASSS